MDSIHSIRCPPGKRKPTSTLVCSPTEWRTQKEGEEEGKDSQGGAGSISSRWYGGEKNRNLSGSEGTMLLTACWNALNSCLFNYANVNMQMTAVRNTMLSQLGDRLTRVSFREWPHYCPSIRLQANSFWPVIIVMRHQQGGLTRRLRGAFCLRVPARVGDCGRASSHVIFTGTGALPLLVQLLRS